MKHQAGVIIGTNEARNLSPPTLLRDTTSGSHTVVLLVYDMPRFSLGFALSLPTHSRRSARAAFFWAIGTFEFSTDEDKQFVSSCVYACMYAHHI